MKDDKNWHQTKIQLATTYVLFWFLHLLSQNRGNYIFPFEKMQKKKTKKNHLENWKPYQLTSVPQITHTTRQTTGAKNVLINLIKENFINSAEIST